MQMHRASRLAVGNRLLCPVTGKPLVSLFPSAMSVTLAYTPVSIPSARYITKVIEQHTLNVHTAFIRYGVVYSPWWVGTHNQADAWSVGSWNPAETEHLWGDPCIRQDNGTSIVVVGEWSHPTFYASGGPPYGGTGGGVLTQGPIGLAVWQYNPSEVAWNRNPFPVYNGIRVLATMDADGTWISGVSVVEVIHASHGTGTDGRNPQRAFNTIAAWSFPPERIGATFATTGSPASVSTWISDSQAETVNTWEPYSTVTPTASVNITWGGT